MIELISVHIPKTGGTSFGAILERLYGDRLYRPDDSLPWDEMAKRTPARTRAVHGHLVPRDFLRAHPTAAVTAWFRHPVDWAISYYRYWLQTPPDGNAHHDIVVKERPSIVEFVERRLMEPTPREYLADVPVGRLGFIGCTAHFEADVGRFLRWLEDRVDPAFLASPPTALWGDEVPWLNWTRVKPAIRPSEREALGALLADEIAFYGEILSVRAERIG